MQAKIWSYLLFSNAPAPVTRSISQSTRFLGVALNRDYGIAGGVIAFARCRYRQQSRPGEPDARGSQFDKGGRGQEVRDSVHICNGNPAPAWK
jgi:hypothetical protein